jgi:hypothetical protein
MIAKFPRNAKMACNLLVFNALCIAVLSLFFPFSLAWNLCAAVFNTFKDYVQPLAGENKNIYRQYYPKTNKKTQAHVSGGIRKEDVRNN